MLAHYSKCTVRFDLYQFNSDLRGEIWKELQVHTVFGGKLQRTCSPLRWTALFTCKGKKQLDLKNTVQRKLREIKIGINRAVWINCLAGKCHLPRPIGHHHERSINIFSGFSTF
jgi:hypothetical protein